MKTSYEEQQSLNDKYFRTFLFPHEKSQIA